MWWDTDKIKLNKLYKSFIGNLLENLPTKEMRKSDLTELWPRIWCGFLAHPVCAHKFDNRSLPDVAKTSRD